VSVGSNFVELVILKVISADDEAIADLLNVLVMGLVVAKRYYSSDIISANIEQGPE